jgi:hypothetical protein
MTAKGFGWIVLAIATAFGGGWLVGASGRSGVEQARGRAEERSEFSEVRALVLEGRISLFLVNFGDASRKFEQARTLARSVQTHLRETGQAERAGRLEIVIGHLGDAQRLAAALDAGAQNAAEQALTALSAASPE